MTRKKRTSLKHQAKSAIYGCHKPRMDKHSHKKSVALEEGHNNGTHKIFSYASRKSMISFVDHAMPFIKENNPQIKFVREITVTEWNQFLMSKTKECSTATLHNYASLIRKLEQCFAHYYGCQVNWTKGLIVPKSEKTPNGNRLRDKQIELDDYKKCLAHATRPGTTNKAYIAWELTFRFGCRVSGDADVTVGDIHFDKPGKYGHGQLHVREKGGRSRFIDIRTANDKEFLQNLAEGKSTDEHLVGIKADSINKTLNRTLKALGLKSKYPETSVHALRKLYAQNCWDENRKTGMSYKDNVAYMNSQLGHGANRDVQLLQKYVTGLEKY